MANNIHDDLLLRHKSVLPSWLALYYDQPIALVSGQGRHVTDAAGETYLDFFAGILTNMVGYNIPEINDAIHSQVDKIVHTSTLYLIPQMVELAEEIKRLSGIENAKVFFTSSGSEANDAALLLASSYRNSNQIFAMRNSYHGRTFSTMPITGNKSWSASAFSPFQVTYVHGAYQMRSPMRGASSEEYIAFAKDDVRDLMGIAASGDVAAIIAEPIQGVGGFATPPDGMYAALKEETDRNSMLWISDEVQTAWGRTGENFWGYQAHGITPDIMTFAKGLGNGYSIGGVVARAEVMDCLQANSISTFGGNPLSSTAALATLKYLHDNNLQENALQRGTMIRERLNALHDRHSVIAEVRGKGLMQGIELVEADGITPNARLASELIEKAREAGLLIGKGGLHGNCLRIAPPLSVTEDECAQALDIIDTAFASIGKV
jgi:4-aminobutyrate aminotransferase